MDDERARLASAATILDELVARITEAGEHLVARHQEALAHEVFEVERSLRTAQRRLSAVVRRKDPGG